MKCDICSKPHKHKFVKVNKFGIPIITEINGVPNYSFEYRCRKHDKIALNDK